MKYLPSAIVDAELDIARAAYFGGEFGVYMTQVAAVNLGQVDLSAAGVGSWTPNQGSSIRVGGGDLQIVPITPINSSVPVQITLAGLDTSGSPAPIAMTATFAAPARAGNQSANFARGFAQDLTVIPKVTHSATYAVATNVATIVTQEAHGYISTQHVDTSGFTVTALNVSNVAITVIDPHTFTYAATHADVGTTADTGGIITPHGTTQLVSSITASQTPTIVGGGNNQSFRVYQLPAVTDYELIQATMEIDFNTKDRPAKGIDAGMESDFWVKRGKSQPGELSIGSKFRSFTDGMARYSGQKCTCMLLGLKEGQTTVDRLVFTQWVGAIKPKLPEGDGEATQESAGKFVDHLFFIAP